MRLLALCLVAASAAGRPLGRALSETVSIDDECLRWGFVAQLACPELGDGDIRGACAACPGVVRRVQHACYDAYPGDFCSGDCGEIPDGMDACSGECYACEDAVACSACPAACFTHAHCYDPETDSFSTPTPPASREPLFLEGCADMGNVYQTNGCCNPETAGSAVYVRVA